MNVKIKKLGKFRLIINGRVTPNKIGGDCRADS